MDQSEVKKKVAFIKKDVSNQRGSAIVIALFILVLISVFVALALSRTSSEAAAIGNETAESRTFYAAQGSLETMTRNFNKVFEVKLSPADAAFDPLRGNRSVPGFTAAQYTFDQEVDNINSGRFEVIDKGAFAGLYATRDNWRLRTTATDPSGIQVQLTRNIQNNRIPIFQFGIFYNDDMELHPGARFDFGGRVHSNGSLFLMSSAGIYFSSRVSAVGEVITDINRNGKAWNDGWGEQVFVKNGSNKQLLHDKGSALTTGGGPLLFKDPNKPLYNPDMPKVYTNTDWDNSAKDFGGNLLAHQKSLDLPLKIASARSGAALDYVELIKRGKSVGDLFNDGGTPTAPTINPVTAAKADSEVTASERYYNKTGIRISIADSKAKLPGCASGVGTAAVTAICGVRLDGASSKPATAGNPWDSADADGSHGYQPLPMTDGYQATRLNAERFRTSAGEVWIKIEMVSKDSTTNAINAVDITEDMLSLGVTEVAPFGSLIQGYGSADSRSVIKLQRFAIPGTEIVSGNNRYLTSLNIGGNNYNLVVVDDRTAVVPPAAPSAWTPQNNYFTDYSAHYKLLPASTALPVKDRRIVPFPIEMFDTREGVYSVDNAVFNAGATYGANVPWMGVMSMVDIDVANLRRFLEGDFNNLLPTGTKFYNGRTPNRSLINTDIPQNNGWVVYLSDRRGDSDFDGEYDMEDVFGGNNDTMETGENVNRNTILDVNYTNEAIKYSAGGLFSSSATVSGYGSYVQAGYAATVDHPFYRRGVRLINGFRLPGKYVAANSSETRGFTFASENGVYVLGNYNATGIASVGSPTPYSDYLPIGEADVPASVVGDAVYVLSNAWTDSNSFRNPYVARPTSAETYVRFAMIAGDPLSSLLVAGQPNQGSGDARLSGGVHNFKRYLEKWNVRLNYCGSLINLYNSRNNTGTQKSNDIVYGAPTRNWVFDSSFLDPTRLPPGTPYFQYVQTTGFQRTND